MDDIANKIMKPQEELEILFWHLYRVSFYYFYNYQQVHNYFTNYYTVPTCFDTIVSSSMSS